MEITSRSSPGFAAKTVPIATGVEILEVLVRWAVNTPIDKDLLTPKWNKSASHRYYQHKQGRIISISGFNQIHEQLGVENVLVLNDFKVGDVLKPMNNMNRLFYVMTVADSSKEASRLAAEALNSVKIEII